MDYRKLTVQEFNAKLQAHIDAGCEFILGGFIDETAPNDVHFIKLIQPCKTGSGETYIKLMSYTYYTALDSIESKYITLWQSELLQMLKHTIS